MNAFWDKLLHFATGIAVGVGFWWVLERYTKQAARTINPIMFLVMLVWGASGLFFFRKMGFPILDHTFFYMAFPDWDIPLYQSTGLRLLLHRSWLFHSVIIPMTLLVGWVWYSQRPTLTQWQRTFANLLRDGAMGLSVGVSAHLLWDALLSSTRRGFYIRGLSGTGSSLWLLVNVAVGIGVPLLIAWTMQHPSPASSPER